MRNFDFTTDCPLLWQNNNKYFVNKTKTVAGGDLDSNGDVSIVISDPVPAVDPVTAGYMYQVLRVRDGVTTALTLTTDFTYTSLSATLKVLDCEADDVIKYYYTAAAYIAAQDYVALNDTDPYYKKAYHASIYMVSGGSGEYMTKLDSFSFDAAFARTDIYGIGSRVVDETGVESHTVKVSMSAMVGDSSPYRIEEKLQGVAANYGRIDPAQYLKNIKVVCKLYDDALKSNFVLGYEITDLSVSANDKNTPVNAFLKKSVEMTSDNVLITDNESLLSSVA
jgi:hypothetical protein